MLKCISMFNIFSIRDIKINLSEELEEDDIAGMIIIILRYFI